MKKVHFGKSKFSTKTFYSALAICLVAIGAATYVSVDRTLGKLKDDSMNLPPESMLEWGFPNQPTEKPQENVPIIVSQPPAQPEAPKQTNATEQKQNAFAMPLSGEVLNKFSNSELVKSKTLGDWRTHDGIDVKGEVGTPVKAVSDGKVTEIKEDTMWGVCVVVDHNNGYVGYYYGLNTTVNVKKDQELKIGDVIGSIGQTGQAETAEEPHLHFGLKKLGKWIDPESVLQK